MQLEKRIIVVTGGAAGIGAATAKLCVDRGASVVIGDIDQESGARSAKATGAMFARVDVADEESVRSLFRLVADRFGRLDVLVHAAGILEGSYVPLAEFSTETFRKVLDVNTLGSFLCAKHAAALMKESGSGVIILVSSGAATRGSSSFAYGTSKGGVNSLALVLTNSLKDDNIRVNVVAPGNIDTGMKRSVIAAEMESKHRRPDALEKAVTEAQLGEPEGIARVLAWLASAEADYVRGVVSTR